VESYFSFPDFYAFLFVAVVITAFLLAVGVLAAVTAADTPRGQKIIRDHLGRQLAGTRMWSMLEHRQISPLAYVDQTSIGNLRAQIKTCRHCAKQDMCDETLGYVGNRHRNYGFCPNRKAMDEVAGHASH
jgi:hypothetical protein